MKKRKFLIVCFAALYLSAAPAMADFVDLTAYDTLMTVTHVWDGFSATTTVEAEDLASSMDMYIKNNDGTILQSLIVAPYDLTTTLDFTVAGDVYSATGSFLVYDYTSSINPKIAATFVSTAVTFTVIVPGFVSVLNMTGYLTPQPGNTSILLEGNPWEFAINSVDKISLVNADNFNSGTMVVFEYFAPYGSLQDYLSTYDATGQGKLNAEIHSTPIPAAVLLGIIGLGVVGLKLRKYA